MKRKLSPLAKARKQLKAHKQLNTDLQQLNTQLISRLDEAKRDREQLAEGLWLLLETRILNAIDSAIDYAIDEIT